MKLQSRFFLYFSALGFLLLLVFSTAFYWLEHRRAVEEQESSRLTTLRRTATVCRESLLTANDIPAINFMRMLAIEPGIVLAHCLDPSGRARAATDARDIGGFPQGIPPEGESLRDGASVVRFSAQDKRVVALRAAVPMTAEAAGRVLVGHDEAFLRRDVRQRLWRTLRRIAAIFALTAALVVPALALFLARALSRPIRELAEGTRKIGDGDFTHRIRLAHADELGELAEAFNSMGKRLGELDDLKDQFLATITHDLRNPLGAMLGYAELLQSEAIGGLADRQKHAVVMILGSGKFLKELVDNILDLAKLRAGRMEFQRESVDARALLSELQGLMQVTADEFKVALETRAAAQAPPVSADRSALFRVLTNLVSNALKFTPPGGRVTVDFAGGEDNRPLFTIQDSGVGIPKEKQAELFSRFMQVDRNLHAPRKVKGTGLGLAICKEIVEGHGGRIWVESEPGRGTRFCFTLGNLP